MTLVDANILIDLFTDDPEWSDWSEAQLIEQSRYGLIGINVSVLFPHLHAGPSLG